MASPQPERRNPLRELLQTWGMVISMFIAIGTVGWKMTSALYDIDAKIERYHAISQHKLALVEQQQGQLSIAVAAFQAPGPRFTAADGDKLRAELHSLEMRVRELEKVTAVYEDRKRTVR